MDYLDLARLQPKNNCCSAQADVELGGDEKEFYRGEKTLTGNENFKIFTDTRVAGNFVGKAEVSGWAMLNGALFSR